jgi:hypothetical protein
MPNDDWGSRPVLSFPGVPKSDTRGSVALSYGNKAPSGVLGGLFDTSWIGSSLGLNYGTPVVPTSGPSFEQNGRGGSVTTGSLDGSAGFSDLLKTGVGSILSNMGARNDEPQFQKVAYTEPGQAGSSMLPIVLLGGAALVAGTYFLAR